MNVLFTSIKISRSLCGQHELIVSNPFSMQSEFTALYGVIHDFTSLKQEFEQIIDYN